MGTIRLRGAEDDCWDERGAVQNQTLYARAAGVSWAGVEVADGARRVSAGVAGGGRDGGREEEAGVGERAGKASPPKQRVADAHRRPWAGCSCG